MDTSVITDQSCVAYVWLFQALITNQMAIQTGLGTSQRSEYLDGKQWQQFINAIGLVYMGDTVTE